MTQQANKLSRSHFFPNPVQLDFAKFHSSISTNDLLPGETSSVSYCSSESISETIALAALTSELVLDVVEACFEACCISVPFMEARETNETDT